MLRKALLVTLFAVIAVTIGLIIGRPPSDPYAAIRYLHPREVYETWYWSDVGRPVHCFYFKDNDEVFGAINQLRPWSPLGYVFDSKKPFQLRTGKMALVTYRSENEILFAVYDEGPARRNP